MDQPSVVKITFTPDGGGWASCTLAIGEASYLIPSISYTTDPLGDLVRAALMIATGANSARLSFDGEPVETRWVLQTDYRGSENLPSEASADAGLVVRLLEFDDIYGHAPDSAGRPLLAATCDMHGFIRAVLAEADRLREPENKSWLTGPGLLRDQGRSPLGIQALRSVIQTLEAKA